MTEAEQKGLGVLLLFLLIIIFFACEIISYYKEKRRIKTFAQIGQRYSFSPVKEDPFDKSETFYCTVLDVQKNYYGKLWVKYQYDSGEIGTDTAWRFYETFKKCENN